MNDTIHYIPIDQSNILLAYLRAQNPYDLECLKKVYINQKEIPPEEQIVIDAIDLVLNEKK